jgi:tetratricopeptide (TPR) repeat protein
MAILAVGGGDLVLTSARANLYDRLLLRSFGGSLRVPLGAIAEVAVVEQAWHVVAGVDTRPPRKDEARTMIVTRVKGPPEAREFVAVYGVWRPAVMVLLDEPSPLSSIVVTVHDPKSVAASIQVALGATPGAVNIKEGDRLAGKGLFADAEAAYRAAIAVNPTCFYAYYKLSDVLLELKRYQEAERALRNALLLRDRHVRLLMRRSDAQGA